MQKHLHVNLTPCLHFIDICLCVTAVDIRRDDSVFSVQLMENEIVEIGTSVTVNTVTIQSNLVISKEEQATQPRSRKKSSAQSSHLFTMDVTDVECCGSFVAEPNIALAHPETGYYLYLWDNFAPMEVSRVSELLSLQKYP